MTKIKDVNPKDDPAALQKYLTNIVESKQKIYFAKMTSLKYFYYLHLDDKILAMTLVSTE